MNGLNETRLAGEDVALLNDFIAESREYLVNIELNLIELERDPGSTEIINAVYRTFHTMKGVSGFLQLDKLNDLCHHTENLIDSARSGNLFIGGGVADLILESVDTIQLMLEEIEKNPGKRVMAYFKGIDVSRLIAKIKRVETSHSRYGMTAGWA